MGRNQLKILIVEDDLVIAENLRETLEEMGYENIKVSTTSDAAITEYKQFLPDLLLVDIQLKNSTRDGIETIRFLEAGNEVPIIYLTAFADSETRKRAKSTYPAAYLIKPASKTQIDISIDIAVSNFQSKSSTTTPHICPLFTRQNYIFIKNGERFEKCLFTDIAYIKAEGSYCSIYSEHKNWVVSMYLSKLLNHLNHDSLIRCHRSYAVNFHQVQSFDFNNLHVLVSSNIVKIPVGDQFRSEITKSFHKI